MLSALRWLLLVIGFLSSLSLSGVTAEAQAGVGGDEDGRGGLSGGSFWRWASPSDKEPSKQGEAVLYAVVVPLEAAVGVQIPK